MADPDGNGIWELTVPIMADSIEFKYAYDNWTGQENLTPGDPCTKTTGGFTNRFILLTGDTVLPAYCWESCDSCSSTPPATYDVTFQVDLSDYAGSYGVVNLNGTFNGWCGGCAVMTDANNDSIYELTVPLDIGVEVEYKFTLDGWNVDEQLMQGMPCTKTTGGFTNRVYTPTSDTTLLPVCWESCDTCFVVSTGTEIGLNSIEIFPNPTTGLVQITGNLNASDEVRVTITDSRGAQLYQRVNQRRDINQTLDLSDFDSGIYFITIGTSNDVITRRILLAK